MHIVRRPSPPLSDFVEMLWLWQGEPAPAHRMERVLPDGSVSIIVNLFEDRIPIYDKRDTSRFENTSGTLLVGAQSCFDIIDAAQPAVASVKFRPGGAWPFFKPPGGALQDQQIPLDEIWRASHLRERMLEAPTGAAMLDVLEQMLLQQIVRPLETHPAVRFALRAFSGARSIAEVTEQIGMSARRFVDVFRNEVGMSPKAFCRVRRFHQAIRRIHAAESVDWTDVALSCGYYDQSHFIHDFRAFAGVSPTAYLSARTAHANHVVLA
jgi:AraC-like DNA-binding protein